MTGLPMLLSEAPDTILGMEFSPTQIWFAIGVLLAVAEAVLPGLVAIFVGLGAATVGVLLWYGQIHSPLEQLLTFFISTTVYLFTLRLLVMRFYPSDTETQNIDEIQDVQGQLAEVVESIPVGGVGRIEQGDSTWPAKADCDREIQIGEDVVIEDRNNFTWVVRPEKSDTES